MKNIHMMLFKHGEIINEEDFFERLFPKKSYLYVGIAYKLFELAYMEKLKRNSYRTLPQELKITLAQYYYTINKLRYFGILKLLNDTYVPDDKFIKGLRFYINYYLALNERFGEIIRQVHETVSETTVERTETDSTAKKSENST